MTCSAIYILSWKDRQAGATAISDRHRYQYTRVIYGHVADLPCRPRSLRIESRRDLRYCEYGITFVFPLAVRSICASVWLRGRPPPAVKLPLALVLECCTEQ